jgi:hypothetical protein
MPWGKIFFHVKKYSNDVARIFVEYFIYMTRNISLRILPSSHAHAHNAHVHN